MSTLMWEVVAADGRTDELVAWALEHADPQARVYRSSDRVVVIDPTGRGPGEPPAELLARAAHAWSFDEADRS